MRTSYFSHNTLVLPPWQNTNSVMDRPLDPQHSGTSELETGCRCPACRALAKAGAVRLACMLG